jgi:hypothetical protein
MLKISKSGAEPAARGAREKTGSPHNAAPARGQAGDAGPADAADGPASKPAKAAAKRARGLERPALPIETQTPRLSGGFEPAQQTPRLETSASTPEDAPAGAKSGPKRAASASVARPRLGPAGRLLKRWLARHFDSEQLESVAPLASELLSLADSLYEVRCELASGALATSERVKLRRLETQLSAAFGRTWRLLGLADDAPATMPRGRPPRPE